MKTELTKLAQDKDEQLHNLLNQWKTEFAEASNHQRELEDALKAAKASIAELEDQKAALMHEVDEWRQQAVQDAEAAKKLKERDNTLAEVEEVLRKVELDLQRKDEALAELGSQLDNREEKLKQKSDSLVDIGRKVELLEQELARIRQSADEDIRKQYGQYSVSCSFHSRVFFALTGSKK